MNFFRSILFRPPTAGVGGAMARSQKEGLLAPSGDAPLTCASASGAGSRQGACRSDCCKRVLDLTLAMVLAPLVLPVALLVALAIKLVSPGPVFFVQWRVGRHGRRFRCFKFRTMKPDASQAVHMEHVSRVVATRAPMRKLDGKDSRLIPLGRWLRAAGLDEIPQIWNVVRGEMSWIGPRPCAEYEFELLYPQGQRTRFEVLPGLTGLWQVSGKNDMTFDDMKRFDAQYVRNGSLLMDLGIIAKTPGVMIEHVLGLVGENLGLGGKTGAPVLESGVGLVSPVTTVSNEEIS